jgi:hypothetical protein
MTITNEQIVEALRAQRDTILAGSKDNSKLRKIRYLIYSITGVHEPNDASDADKELRAFLVTPKNFDEYCAIDSLTVLLHSINGMSEADKVFFRELLIQFAESPAPEVTTKFKAYCYDRLIALFDVHLVSDPKNITLDAVVTNLNSTELDEESLDASINIISGNRI